MRVGGLVALSSLAGIARACLHYGLTFDLVDDFVEFSFIDDGQSTCSGRWYSWQGDSNGEYFWAPNCLNGYRVEVQVCGAVGACPQTNFLVTYGTPHGTWDWSTTWFGFTSNGHAAAGVLDTHFC